MFKPIIDFISGVWHGFLEYMGKLWDGFADFILLILGWLLDLVIAWFDGLIVLVKFIFVSIYDTIILPLINEFVAFVFEHLPVVAQYGTEFKSFLMSIDQIFPVSETLAISLSIFSFWVVVFIIKIILKAIPGVY